MLTNKKEKKRKDKELKKTRKCAVRENKILFNSRFKDFVYQIF